MKNERKGVFGAFLAAITMALWMILDVAAIGCMEKNKYDYFVSDEKYDGLNVLVGIENKTSFNFLALLLLIIILIGIIIVCLYNEKYRYIAIICFVLAAILMFVIPYSLSLFYTGEFEEIIKAGKVDGDKYYNEVTFNTCITTLLMLASVWLSCKK